jgi:NADH:ubiquinone reductase (H+-translocating)
MEPKPNPASTRIVILGGGFAGAYCAEEFERYLQKTNCEVFLLDRHNYFIFYPFLIEAGTGGIEPRHAVVPLRPFLKKTHFHTGEIESVDPALQKVFYRIPSTDQMREVDYDHLVIALGSTTRMLNVPGMREWGREIKTLADAIALRDRAIQMLEQAESATDGIRRTASLHFVIVGGNFTGAELAGQLKALLNRASRFYRHLSSLECRVTLVEISDRILSALDPELSAYAAQHLSELGVDVRLRTSVQEVSPDWVRLSTGEQVATSTLICCAGVAPNPVVSKLNLPFESIDGKGYILCNRDLRVRSFANVWAIGDCAVITDAKGKPYPAMAQHALREGRVLARNLARVLAGQPPLPCDIKTRGSIAALGDHRGVARIGRFRVSGVTAWLINRAYYVWALPGWSRRLRIVSDWTLDLLFSRDYVHLGAHTTIPPTGNTRRAA